MILYGQVLPEIKTPSTRSRIQDGYLRAHEHLGRPPRALLRLVLERLQVAIDQAGSDLADAEVCEAAALLTAMQASLPANIE